MQVFSRTRAVSLVGPNKVGAMKGRRECETSEYTPQVFCLILCSFARMHPVATAQGKYKFCFQCEGEEGGCSPGR